MEKFFGNFLNQTKFLKNFSKFSKVSYVDRTPKPGESVRGNLFKNFCGGKGANQAVMASKLGTRTAMMGCVGDDIFAETNISSISQNGVDTSMIEKLKESNTGVACITVTSDG